MNRSAELTSHRVPGTGVRPVGGGDAGSRERASRVSGEGMPAWVDAPRLEGEGGREVDWMDG